jgi:hypothetical protein
MEEIYYICTNCDFLLEKSTCIVKAFFEILPHLTKPKLSKRYECPFCNKSVKMYDKISPHTIQKYPNNLSVNDKI